MNTLKKITEATSNIRYNLVIAGVFLAFFLFSSPSSGNAQGNVLFFGTVKAQDKTMQGRFEVTTENGAITSIVYAPYGISPVPFQNVALQKNQLTFIWQIDDQTYRCLLVQHTADSYSGNCDSDNRSPIQLTIRGFSEQDAILQGDSLHATMKDVEILNRALSLLNNGSNWSRLDNRICDAVSYPYKWSLFCALHQASIDIDGEYRHLRPAIQATRQAINEYTSGKQYAHLLQDFNNEAQSFDPIAKTLIRAKEIIIEKIKLRQ